MIGEKHREKLAENLANGIIAAFSRGEEIEIKRKDMDKWESIGNIGPSFMSFDCDYRIKPEPPKIALLTFKDIHPRMVFRKIDNKEQWFSADGVDQTRIVMLHSTHDYNDLSASFEFSFNAMRWFPCTQEGLAQAKSFNCSLDARWFV